MSAPPPGGREGEIFQDSDARYRGLLEAAPDAMVVVNQGGEIVLLNVQAEKQFGYSRDELVGQKVTNIIPVGFAERLIADDLRSAAEALAQQIGTGIELTALRKDGSEFPIEIMLSPFLSAWMNSARLPRHSPRFSRPSPFLSMLTNVSLWPGCRPSWSVSSPPEITPSRSQSRSLKACAVPRHSARVITPSPLRSHVR